MAEKPTYEELERKVKELEKEAANSKRAEKALRESEEKFRTLFEASTDGILITDIETRNFKYANPASCRLLGYSEEEIRGLRVPDLHPKDRLRYVISEFEAHVKGQTTLAESIPFLRKDGTAVYVDISGTTVIIDGKNCSIGFLRDITDRNRAEKKAKEQLRFLQTLIDTLPTPIFYKDKAGKYTGCNRAFEEFVGRPRGKIIGKTVYDMGPKHIADKYNKKDQELFQNPGKQVYEWKVQTKSGEVREVIFNKATITDEDGKVIGLIGGISDLTERKRVEEAVRQSEKRMEILKFANDVALKLMHELRNPLVTIGGFSKRLSSRDYPEDKLKEYATVIFEGSKRLDKVLNEVLANLKAAAEHV